MLGLGLVAAGFVAVVTCRSRIVISEEEEEEKKNRMVVMVGTKNQGKIDALISTMTRWKYDFEDVKGVKVKSGVRDQPYGFDETKDGAMNRAKRAFDHASENAYLGVGLESGVLIDSKDGTLFDFCVCSIYDGKKHHIGGTYHSYYFVYFIITCSQLQQTAH